MRSLALSMEFDLAKYQDLNPDQSSIITTKEVDKIDSVVHNIQDLMNENK